MPELCAHVRRALGVKEKYAWYLRDGDSAWIFATDGFFLKRLYVPQFYTKFGKHIEECSMA